ncbi:MAG: hypothetical protein RLY86_4013 [Pseudomonadota bacterium]|jgi:hypothetical protein
MSETTGRLGWRALRGLGKGCLGAAALGMAILVGLPGPASAQTLDLKDPADSLAVMRKIQCHAEDGKPAFYWWSGDVYSRRQGERDVLLFKVEGMNVRTCQSVTDEKRGAGFRLVSREILLYLDPKTGQPLSTWTNPWTGEAVEVMHVANDPVNNGFFAVGRDGKPAAMPFFEMSGTVFLNFEVPLFYTNPLGGAYQAEVGGTYHATEMFNFAAQSDVLLDPKTTTAPDAIVGWARISQWLPWMKMGGREGVLYFHTIGKRVDGIDAMPAVLRDAIRTTYPTYAEPPPVDDARPNETSWTVYQKEIEKRGKPAAPAGGK